MKAPSEGICKGLEEPVDNFTEALFKNFDKTPEDVVVTGTKVVTGYDGGCRGE